MSLLAKRISGLQTPPRFWTCSTCPRQKKKHWMISRAIIIYTQELVSNLCIGHFFFCFKCNSHGGCSTNFGATRYSYAFLCASNTRIPVWYIVHYYFIFYEQIHHAFELIRILPRTFFLPSRLTWRTSRRNTRGTCKNIYYSLLTLVQLPPSNRFIRLRLQLFTLHSSFAFLDKFSRGLVKYIDESCAQKKKCEYTNSIQQTQIEYQGHGYYDGNEKWKIKWKMNT